MTLEPTYPPKRSVMVKAGRYATVRAIEKAKKRFGEDATVAGIVAWDDRYYIYEVVDLCQSRRSQARNDPS
jgi:hypothetical protein